MEQTSTDARPTKFCQHCGQKIFAEAVVCTHCGCQVAAIKQTEQPNIIVKNINENTNVIHKHEYESYYGYPRSKWVAFLLCLFLGGIGAHKLYEGKPGIWFLYLITFGIFGIGWFIDLIVLLFKPNPYYV